jgi:hypothetical protein
MIPAMMAEARATSSFMGTLLPLSGKFAKSAKKLAYPRPGPAKMTSEPLLTPAIDIPEFCQLGTLDCRPFPLKRVFPNH